VQVLLYQSLRVTLGTRCFVGWVGSLAWGLVHKVMAFRNPL